MSVNAFSKFDQKVITDNYVYLKENLRVEDLLIFLMEKLPERFTIDFAELLSSERNPQLKFLTFFGELFRSGPRAYAIFCASLGDKYDFIQDQLKATEQKLRQQQYSVGQNAPRNPSHGPDQVYRMEFVPPPLSNITEQKTSPVLLPFGSQLPNPISVQEKLSTFENYQSSTPYQTVNPSVQQQGVAHTQYQIAQHNIPLGNPAPQYPTAQHNISLGNQAPQYQTAQHNIPLGNPAPQYQTVQHNNPLGNPAPQYQTASLSLVASNAHTEDQILLKAKQVSDADISSLAKRLTRRWSQFALEFLELEQYEVSVAELKMGPLMEVYNASMYVLQTWKRKNGIHATSKCLLELCKKAQKEGLMDFQAYLHLATGWDQVEYWRCRDEHLTQQQLSHLAPEIGTEWTQLAMDMGFSQANLSHFDMTHNDSIHRVSKMLCDWKARHGEKATVYNLSLYLRKHKFAYEVFRGIFNPN